MVQVPDANNEAVVPDTVHTLVVDEAKLTGKAEVAVATNCSVPATACVGMVGNVIVCPEGVLFTTIICPTVGAAA
jgi:hypothetical protein